MPSGIFSDMFGDMAMVVEFVNAFQKFLFSDEKISVDIGKYLSVVNISFLLYLVFEICHIYFLKFVRAVNHLRKFFYKSFRLVKVRGIVLSEVPAGSSVLQF